MAFSLWGVFKNTGQGESWIREVEHLVLRIGSFVIALASAHSIRWFLSPLDGVDPLQPAMNWLVAVCVGVFGYFLTRGLAHRLMNEEQVWLYVPLCVLIEFVEVYCNFIEAFSHVAVANWLQTVPHNLWGDVMVFLGLVVYSCIPLISAALAVVDMDFERQKLKRSTRLQGLQSPVSPPNGQQLVPPVQPRQGQQPVQGQQGLRPGQSSRSQIPPLPSKQGSAQRGIVGNPPPGVTRQQGAKVEADAVTEAL